jgi:predicted dehydrogenase
MAEMHGRRLRCAMVGGGRDAFIGAVHRHAMALDGTIDLVAGALSSKAEKALASGRDLGLRADRNHGSWQTLLANELSLGAEERIDFVSIVTPNDVHHEVAKAFAEAGIHVVCDKPLVPTSAEADEMVKTGVLGDIRKVVVEYHQGWLATRVEDDGNKQADWRTDPTRSVAGAIADIGSHAENLVATVTGLSIESLCADLHAFIPGRRLDDDASLLLRFAGGARGVLLASQIAAGCENDLHLRIFGSEGMLDWRQEDPNTLVHAPVDSPRQVLSRGSPWLGEAARRASRLPSGHPEGFLEAFANVYAGIAAEIRARLSGIASDPIAADYADVEAGARGVRFIEATLASARSQRKWTSVAEGGRA